MKTWIATAITTIALTSNAAMADVEQCQHGFDTAEAALHSALNDANPASIASDQLVIGSVYEYNDRFYATYRALPQGANMGSVALTQPSGVETVAVFRTSGDNDDNLHNQLATRQDRRASRSHDVDYYVADSSGDLFVLADNTSRYKKIVDDGSNNAIASRESDKSLDTTAIVAVITTEDCSS